MGIIEESLSSILEGGVKMKGRGKQVYRPLSKNHRATISMLASKTPEVMAKITGFSRGANNIAPHILYISREGNEELESDRGIIYNGKDEVEQAYSKWIDDLNNFPKPSKKPSREVMHLMLSMPAGTDPEKVKNSARIFAKKTFSENHEYLFSLHTDTPHPHVHLAVKMLGHNQERLNPRKADIQAWREGFAMELRGQGVRAVASKRRARGVVKKAVNNTVHHINKGDDTHKKRVANVTALQMKDAVDELVLRSKGKTEPVKPWEEAIKANQTDVHKLYETAISELEKTGKEDDGKLASDLRKIKSDLPKKITTQHMENMQKAQADILGNKPEKVIDKIKDISLSR